MVVQVSLREAKGQLLDLVRRAEAGEGIIFTRDGHPVVRLVRVKQNVNRESRRALMEAISAAGKTKASPGPSAARSQDFLYDDEGLPA